MTRTPKDLTRAIKTVGECWEKAFHEWFTAKEELGRMERNGRSAGEILEKRLQVDSLDRRLRRVERLQDELLKTP